MNGYLRLVGPISPSADDGLVVYEVELTAKAKRRLEAIVQGLEQGPQRGAVRLVCLSSTPTQQVVEGAIRRVAAEDRVSVAELRREAR